MLKPKVLLSSTLLILLIILSAACGVQDTTTIREKTPFTAEYLNLAVKELDELSQAGDIQMLEYMYFEDADEAEGFKKVLSDKQGQHIWQLAYASTSWGQVDEIQWEQDSFGSVAYKYPHWFYMDGFLPAELDYKPASDDYKSMVNYYTMMQDKIPYGYYYTSWVYEDGLFKLDAEDFLSDYFLVTSLKELKSPIKPFQYGIPTGTYIPDTSHATETEQQMMTYFTMLSEHRYAEAIRYAQQQGCSDKDGIAKQLNVELAEFYENLSEVDKALVQAEFEEMPLIELVFYTKVSKKDGKKSLEGFLKTYIVSYDPSYGKLAGELPYYDPIITGVKPTWEDMDRFSSIYHSFCNVLVHLFPEAEEIQNRNIFN